MPLTQVFGRAPQMQESGFQPFKAIVGAKLRGVSMVGRLAPGSPVLPCCCIQVIIEGGDEH